MYVIFPADEVVYLSYGRLIYIPSVGANDLEEHLPQEYHEQLHHHQQHHHHLRLHQQVQANGGEEEEEERPTLAERQRRQEIEERYQVDQQQRRQVEFADQQQQHRLLANCIEPLEELRGSSRRRRQPQQRASVTSASSQKSGGGGSVVASTAAPQLLVNDAPVRPERSKQPNGDLLRRTSSAAPLAGRVGGGLLKASPTSASLQPSTKPSASDKRLSYSDFLPVHKCLKPGQQPSNTTTPIIQTTPVSALFDFDELFQRVDAGAPPSPTLSPGSDLYDSRLRAPLQQQTAEKSPLSSSSAAKKKAAAFFLNKSLKPEPRLKRTSDFGIGTPRPQVPQEVHHHHQHHYRKQQEDTQEEETEQQGPPAAADVGSGWLWPRPKMAVATTLEAATLRELTHPGYNEPLKSHNAVAFKLIRTVSDFTQQLSQMYEQHAAELQHLVANFRKRNGELRKERPACASTVFHTWETLLQEVEIDSQALGDIASILGRQVSRPLLEKSFYRKIQSRKVFTHRESYETIISKTEEKLVKCRQEYKNAYVLYLSAPSTETLSGYFNSHNAYVQQLHATNGMLDEYGRETLPQLLQELEEIYTDLCATLSESVIQGAEVVAARAMEQNRRYEGLISQCKNVNGTTDLVHLTRALPVPQSRPPATRRLFVPPQPPPQQQPQQPDGEGDDGPIISNENIPPPLKDELVIDRLSAVQVRPSHDALRKEAGDLDAQIRQIQDALDTLVRLQQRSVEAQLFNKANEIQEDISMKRFDLRVAQLHLSAIHAQKELFSNKLETAGGASSGGGSDSGRERKMSNASQGSMKTKWLKAFKSLKTPPPEADKKNGSAATRELLKGDPDAHNFQEYTYKKITPCDVCSQVLRGHTKQGLRCRICKINVHLDCQEQASKCTAKARLLRRQKSTSEIETKAIEAATLEEESYFEDTYSGMPTMNRQLSVRDSSSRSPQPQYHQIPPNFLPTANSIEASEVDLIYQVLKQAGEISSSKTPPLGGHHSMVMQQQPPPIPPIGINLERGATPSSSGHNLNRLGMRAPNTPSSQTPRSAGSNLCVINPAPCSTSSDRRTSSQGATAAAASAGSATAAAAAAAGSAESSMRRRIFAGMKSLTGFGSRSRRGSPGHRSISLPERMRSMRNSSSAGNFNTETGTHTHSNVAPHSPRRQKLNLRMKSLSLDSPESTEHVQRRKHHGAAATSDPHSNQGSSSRIQSPSSPVHNRRLLSAKNIRMSSVELPDDNEKSPSSASTSPCPSPVGGKHKPHRLLPTNLYVVLYNFKSRHQDELDLKAGYKVTVIDTSDPDWWKGKCLGRVGYFPSKYCSKLSPGEKPLQVTHNLQVSDGDNGLMLLRDQIVIQIGEELDGMVMIRSGDNRQGVCPVKFLQEV